MTAARTRQETASGAMARRLRGILAEEMVTQTEVAGRMGMVQQSFSRRISGAVPFSVDDVIDIARVTGLRIHWLMTGEGEPFGPRGCLIVPDELRARRDSNPQPSDPNVDDSPAQVIEFPAHRRPRVRRLQHVSQHPVRTIERAA